jgi:hypothetical protein
MLTEKEIDGVKYSLIPIPPHVSPFNQLLGQLLQKAPGDCEEAEKDSVQIEKALDKILEACVEPKPRREHAWKLYSALQKLTKKTLEDAGFFRKPKRPGADSSKPAGGPPRKTS